jgi:DNA-binding LytR/AlgR family response regulator
MSATPTTHDVVRIAIDRSFLRGIGVALAVGLMLALTSAFGMSGLSLTARLAYWLPLMLAGAIWGEICSRLVDRWIDMDRRPWLSVVALTVVMSGPLSVLVWAVTRSVFNGGTGGLLDYLGPVVIVTTAVSTLNVFLSRKPVQTHAAPVDGSAPARFLDRLPMKLKGATIRAVESEDHYLRIHTDRGSDLILMRLSDALIELEGLEGAQTHRGWWVAREAVRGVSRGDGRATLTLEGDIQAPVSRRYAKALRDAGWY